ncbi:MAG: integrase [Pseudobdellovibrionaceae bacterium]
MATIRKRNNKYQVQIRRKDYPSLVKSFIKRSDAIEWARAMEVALDRDDLPQTVLNQSGRVSDIITRYRDTVSLHKKSGDSEITILNAFLRTPLAKLHLKQITITHFREYRAERLKSVKAGTVNRELFIIRHAFEMAMQEWGYHLKENPLMRLKKLPVHNVRSRRMNEDEKECLEKAFAGTRNPYIKPLVYFAIETAMRRGEILGLLWENVDLEARTAFLPNTKNGHSRTVPLTLKAIKILSSLPRDGGRVFPVTPHSLRKAWERLLARADIQDLHFHDLRHEAVSSFFEMGLSVPEVSMISGHKSYAMLARYTHLKVENLIEKLQ